MSLQLIRAKEAEIEHLERMIYDAQNTIRQLEKDKQELIKERRSCPPQVCDEMTFLQILEGDY